MNRSRLLTIGLLAALAVLASFKPTTAFESESRNGVPTVTPVPVKRYFLDLSRNQGGGIAGGDFNNFAFNIDSQKPVRSLVARSRQGRNELIATYDFAGCKVGQASLLEAPLNGLADGNAVWLDYVDIEMLPSQQRDVQWKGGVCYGYRKPSGNWYWYLSPTPLTYDAATNRTRARIWIKEADIDALKLVFDDSVPQQMVRSVTLTTLSSDPTSNR